MTSLVEITAPWLADLPAVLDGRVAVHVLGADGRIARHGDDGTRFDGATPWPAPGRVARSSEIGAETIVLTMAAGDAAGPVGALLESLLAGLVAHAQLAEDLESMHPTSLALLEEVSMWGDVLPVLPTGRTEQEVAEMGIRALVVAAGASRAVYVRWHADLGLCEVLAHAVADSGVSGVSLIETEGDRFFDPGQGIIGQTARGDGSAVLARREQLDDDVPLTRLALRDLIAVPVRFGGIEDTRTLGVVLVIDKRRSSYAAQTDLGTQETKLTQAVASMLGSVLGTRRMVELDKEFEMAEDIHRQLQPQSSPRVRGFDIAGRNRACGRVGGDYFDFFELADGRTMAAVLDVSGHDFASGMLIVSARMALQLESRRSADSATVFANVKRIMHADLSRTERFVTAVGVTVAPGKSEIEVVNHGHPDTLILRAGSGRIDAIPSDAPVFGFGILDAAPARRVALDPGDVVLLHTDGVIEACNPDEEMFGDQRLRTVLRAVGGRSATDIAAAIHEAVDQFRGTSPRADDVTIVVIKATGEASA